jgi:hypothetical protein
MINVTLAWTVIKAVEPNREDVLMGTTDFALDDSGPMQQPTLQESLLLQLSCHLAETVFADVVQIAEGAQRSKTRISRSRQEHSGNGLTHR